MNYLLKYTTWSLIGCTIGMTNCKNEKENKPPNILLIVADDLNYSSVGSFRCPIPDVTPNIDTLAAQGIRFTNAHVTTGVCQPSRGAIMTGMYGMHSGIEGFEHLKKDFPTLTEYLRKAGYLTGMLGKVGHSIPKLSTERDLFDIWKDDADIGLGRSPARYYEYSKWLFEKSVQDKKPFFLMANSHDPHRPFYGSETELNNKRYKDFYEKDIISKPSRIFTAEEMVVPGFLPDLPDVRTELAQYYSSVRRLDDMVGEVLKALKESGVENNTLVIFISDNGMSFPFAKTNCYLNSTKTPFIARWPGVIKPGTDTVHFISGIDFLPTFLEVSGIPLTTQTDGFSFLPLLKQQPQDGREKVFTQFYETSGKNRYPMRAVQDTRFGYIFNPWSDGHRVFKNEPQAGLTFKAMQEASSSNTEIHQRVELFLYRVVEEFYDLKNDPDALNNLINDPAYSNEVIIMKDSMRRWMIENNDPALHALDKCTEKEALEKYMKDDAELTIQRRGIPAEK